MYKKTPLIFDMKEDSNPNQLIAPLDVEKPDFAEFFGSQYSDQEPAMPNLSEVNVVRHYTNLSSKNYGVENGFYPLGSCTMKYNPKINEDMAALPGFHATHPLQPVETVQGNLELIYDLERKLCDVFGMDNFTFQPSAGAHGEQTGLLLIKAYHEDRGDTKRDVMIVPDAAHGTNPASSMMVGYKVREVKSDEKGMVDIEALKEALGDDVAGLMLTNPNTLGIFDTNIKQITDLVHEAGGLVYYDGANANAILMQVRPGDMGFDCVHSNVHKTFSTPHGGGGPGAGPVGCKAFLAPYLHKPTVEKGDNGYYLDYDRPKSMGKVRAFAGSFLVMVRAYCYLLSTGAEGLKEVSEGAVANTNYIKGKLAGVYHQPVEQPAMHEFVLSAEWQKERYGCSALDVAKRLIDYGYHPPTMYFPLIVHEALMIEPTETETQEELDGFIAAMKQIAQEAAENPQLLHDAPHDAPIGRPDETKAAREPKVKV